MRVAHNGVGLPPGFDWTQSHSLGLRIVALLTDQLSGTLRTDSSVGTTFTLTFSDTLTAAAAKVSSAPRRKLRIQKCQFVSLRLW
jgi:two-component sensor histidine kinase